jgi:23S rRNA pseudouridine2604 synthase
MTEPVRLAKRLIELVGCSRSEAEKYIAGGWVLVDGKMVDLPQTKVTDEKVSLHPDAVLEEIEPKTILLNLPTGYDVSQPLAAMKLVTPETRSEIDDSAIRTLRSHFSKQMATVPLEKGATGLLVFSQDAGVVRRLVKNANRNEQEYIVDVEGEIAEDGLDRMNAGMKRFDSWLPKAKVSWQNEQRLRFALKDPRPGQLEFMCESVGLKVLAMTRIRIGRVPMKKMQPGQWRYLPSGVMF